MCIRDRDYDALYQNSYDNHSGFSQRPGSATTNENLERAFYFGESDSSTSSMIPYLEYSTGTVSAPVNDSVFFGTNF